MVTLDFLKIRYKHNYLIVRLYAEYIISPLNWMLPRNLRKTKLLKANILVNDFFVVGHYCTNRWSFPLSQTWHPIRLRPRAVAFRTLRCLLLKKNKSILSILYSIMFHMYELQNIWLIKNDNNNIYKIILNFQWNLNHSLC